MIRKSANKYQPRALKLMVMFCFRNIQRHQTPQSDIQPQGHWNSQVNARIWLWATWTPVAAEIAGSHLRWWAWDSSSSFAPSSSWQSEKVQEFISTGVGVLLCRQPLALLPIHQGHSGSPQQLHGYQMKLRERQVFCCQSRFIKFRFISPRLAQLQTSKPYNCASQDFCHASIPRGMNQ